MGVCSQRVASAYKRVSRQNWRCTANSMAQEFFNETVSYANADLSKSKHFAKKVTTLILSNVKDQDSTPCSDDYIIIYTKENPRDRLHSTVIREIPEEMETEI